MIAAQNPKHVLLIAPVTKTNSATASATIDWKGADYATVVVGFASEVNTNAVGPEILVQHCDTSNGTFTTLSSVAHADGSLVAAKQYVFQLDLGNKARFGKIAIATDTTTNDNITTFCEVVLSRLEQAPSNAAGMSGSTNDTVTIV